MPTHTASPMHSKQLLRAELCRAAANVTKAAQALEDSASCILPAHEKIILIINTECGSSIHAPTCSQEIFQRPDGDRILHQQIISKLTNAFLSTYTCDDRPPMLCVPNSDLLHACKAQPFNSGFHDLQRDLRLPALGGERGRCMERQDILLYKNHVVHHLSHECKGSPACESRIQVCSGCRHTSRSAFSQAASTNGANHDSSSTR